MESPIIDFTMVAYGENANWATGAFVFAVLPQVVAGKLS